MADARYPRRAMLAAALAGLAVPAAAPARPRPAPAQGGESKVISLLVYGNDPCPKSQGDEIVVCGRMPESERYRIPKRLRGKRNPGPAGTAWGAQVRTMEYVGRSTMPNSCSVVGSGGQTGCYHQFIEQARAERQQAQDEAASGN